MSEGVSRCRPCDSKGKVTPVMPLLARHGLDLAESQNLCMRGYSKRENREIPSAPVSIWDDRTVSEPLLRTRLT